MTFAVGDPGHVVEHNNIAAQALANSGNISALNTAVTARVAKGELLINVDDQVGVTDDDKISAAIAAASVSGLTKVIWFAAREYVVNTTQALTSISNLTLQFAPGSSIRIGSSPTGTLADRARVFTLTTCSNVTIQGLRITPPSSVLVGTPAGENSIIMLLNSNDCIVERSTFNLTNLWSPSNTYLDASTGGTYQQNAVAVFVKGASSVRNLITDCVVTAGGAVQYAYSESTRTTCRRVTVISAPANGFTGTGNGTAWSEDNVLEDCMVLTCGRIGIEDWSKIRRTNLRNCKVFSPGYMGISLVGTATRLDNPYVEGSPQYIGIELSSTNVVVNGGRVVITGGAGSGIIVDGNTAVGLGDTTAAGALIQGTEVRGGQYGIIQTANINVGQVTLDNCRIYNWVVKGIQLQDVASGGLPGRVSGIYMANSLPSTTGRYGIQVGSGAHVTDCDIRILAAANGGTSGDVLLYFGSNDQHWSNIRVDTTGVTSPSVPISYSAGATPTGQIIEGIVLTGGAVLSLQFLVNPTVRNIVGSSITWGSGGAAVSPIKVSVSGGVDVWSGTGSPETVVTAVVGSQYIRRDGAAGTSLYVKETGSAATGWVGHNTVTSVAARTGAVVLTSTDVGLANVDNTSDVNKPVSTAQATADALALPKAGGTLTGTLNGTKVAVITTTDTNSVLATNTNAGGNASVGVSFLGVTAASSAFGSTVTGDAATRYLATADGKMNWGDGTLARDTNLYRSAAAMLTTDSDLRVATIGKGLRLAEGTNAKAGVATLVTGTKVVTTTAVTATSRIQLTAQSLGTVTAPSALCVSARTAGTSFTILASQATDTSVVYWEIIEPA